MKFPHFSIRRTLAQAVGIYWPKRFGERYSYQEQKSLARMRRTVDELIVTIKAKQNKTFSYEEEARLNDGGKTDAAYEQLYEEMTDENKSAEHNTGT
jgi:hypothetical protein